MASAYLQRNTTQSASSSTTATISVWVKLGNHIGNFNAGVFGTHNDSGDYSAGGNSQIGFYNGGLYAWFKDGSNTYYKQESTRRFRDHNAWYHLVYRFDLTESSASNRIRVYVNNEEITSWDTTNDPPNNVNIQIQKQDRNQRVGTYNFTGGGFNYFDGEMAHFYLCDGQSYAPTVFGETDATTGIWKPKTSPSVSYGTNGFFLKFDNSGNMGLDSSGNSNNFTTNGTIIQNKDTPTNVFATMNPLVPTGSLAFSNVNTTLTGSNDSLYSSNNNSTLGASAGKYYVEVEYDTAGGNTNPTVGVTPITTSATTNPTGSVTDAVVVRMDNDLYVEGTSTSSYLGSTPSAGDIIGIALDLDNGKVWFSLNGTFVGNPVAGTGAAFDGITSGETMCFCTRALGAVFKWNFGNGYFGTTAVSSAQNPSDGIGIFEYSVPSGYKALCTKSINAQEYS